MALVNAQRAKREADMPTEKDALSVMHLAHIRLRELGWSDAIYCPKDGSRFEVIEAGSTGVFTCHYSGTWPEGSWWIEDAGDLWPSRPILYRLFPEDQAKRMQRFAEAAANFEAEDAAS